MAEKPKFYITTPIYYPSGKWHIGTCYTTVVCDAIARFKRMQGFDVMFLTGTDEHGQKVARLAEAAGKTPKEYVDGPVAELKEIWKLIGISYDKFIRTTDKEHVECVQKIFRKLYENGDIYKKDYEGWYCTPCETFWTETQLKDGKCPDCGRPVERTKESSYFFRLSKYQDKLIELLEDESNGFLEPSSRRHEMLNNFLKAGLQDLCVTRTSFKWGVPVPFDEGHVAYVWVDALSNYITALGYLSDDPSAFERYWPASVHMMAKEIVRFHSIIWPALLMSLNLPLPKKVYGHGWLMYGGGKISKSKAAGTLPSPVDLVEHYGVDALRYYLLREVPFGQDGNYTNEAFLTRINSDLVNDLGNLLSRTTAMITQYFDGVLPAPSEYTDLDKELIALADGTYGKVAADVDALQIPSALQSVFALIARANKYIDETTPWALAKKPEERERLGTVLYVLAEVLRISAVLLMPFIQTAPEKIFTDLSCETPKGFDGNVKFGALKPGIKVTKAGILYPRIDVQKELKAMDERAEKAAAAAEKKENKAENKEKKEERKMIAIDDFMNVELRVGKVLECKKLEKSKKLLVSKIEVGDEVRTIVSGIAQYYTPEEMVGKSVVVVANLAPATLCGVVSEGMILCADGADGNVVIVSPESVVATGSRVR